MTPSSRTLPALLATALAADPSRPLLTFADGATGERTELSVATFGNWVAKTANLLVDEVAATPGEVVEVGLPLHWQAAVWLPAAWAAGLVVALPPAGRRDVVVTTHEAGPVGGAVAGAVPVVSLGLGPMGLARPGVAPADPTALDYDRSVHAHGDRFVPVDEPGPDDPALHVGGAALTHAQLVAAAHANPTPGTILLTEPFATVRAVLAGLLVPLAAGVTAVLLRHVDDAVDADLAALVAQERVTAGVGPGTGGLPDWNGDVAGIG